MKIKDKLNLICLPYAGGTKHSFRYLNKSILENVNIHSYDYPGHGNRIKESCLTDMNDIVDDIYSQIQPLLNKPYAIYGHSMGAILSYLLTRKIELNKLNLPLHVFVSGTDAPSVRHKKELRYSLPKDQFIEKLKKLGGMPDEILENEELLGFFEPILRSDFKAVETFKYSKQNPLEVPITVMIGDGEELEEEDVLKWQDETVHQLDVYTLKGGHFFIFDNGNEITDLISKYLAKYS